jgi:outer membrane receptor protein involved in Fe transport
MSSKADGGLWEPNAPRWTVAAGLLFKKGDFKLALIDKVVGAQYSDAANNDLYRLPSYNNLNLTAGYTFGNVEASINIDNVLDSRSVVSISEDGNNLGFTANSTDQYFYQAPRSVMGTLKVKF